MFYKSILLFSISLQLFTLNFPIFADVTKKNSEIRQHTELSLTEDKNAFFEHPTDEKSSTIWDKTTKGVLFFTKGVFWYVAIGGTVFVVAAGSLTLHMLLQLYSRNP